MEEVYSITLEEITNTIVEIIAVCYHAFVTAREGYDTPEEDYDRIAMAALLKWQPEVNRILQSNHQNIGDLHALNDMLSCLTLEPEEYEGVYINQLEDLCEACYNYEQFEPFLEGDFGSNLDDYLEHAMYVQEANEDSNIRKSQYTVV